MTVRLRTATRTDIPALAELHRLSWQIAYRGLVPALFLEQITLQDRIARWERAFETASGDSTVVAVEADQLLGLCSFGRERQEPGRGEVMALHVRPQDQRRGIGRLLLRNAEDGVRSAGQVIAVLGVVRGNEPAQRFYEACGWRHRGEIRAVTSRGFAFEELVYEKQLWPPDQGALPPSTQR
jgi:ribosomal protein S18 acetylase RimI-like enzyme